MRRNISDYLEDILDNIDIATLFLEDLTFEDLENDQRTAYAVVRAIEIVGEAAKSIPLETRHQHPEIPWRSLTGMRDKIVHQYFGVKLRVVWDTVKLDFPELKVVIAQMLEGTKQ